MFFKAVSFSISQLIVGLIIAPVVFAQEYPPPIPGWTHSEAGVLDTPNKHGILLSGKYIFYGSPVVAEIDGDTTNGKEIAVTSQEGVLYVVKADGTLLWSKELPVFGCAKLGSDNRTYASPAVAAIHGDGVQYVVAGYGGIGGKACDGGVVSYRGSDGEQDWLFSLKDYHKVSDQGNRFKGVVGSPAVADTDGDGKFEIGFGSLDRNVYLLNHNGSLRRRYSAADTVFSGPAFANVDGDSELEMIIGTDISRNDAMKIKSGGYVYAFKTTATKQKVYKFRKKNAFVWKTWVDQVMYTSPVVADVLPSSAGEEVIVVSGCYFGNGSNKRGKWVKVLRASDGKVLQTLPTIGCSPSSVAVGDLDSDGVKEIVAVINGNRSIGGDGYSRVYAWKATSSIPLWEKIPSQQGRNDPWGGQFNSPVIADLDGNGSLEVLAANHWAVNIFEGATGNPLTCQTVGCTDKSLLLYTFRHLRSAPAVVDINNDGDLDVIIGGGHAYLGDGRRAVLYGWTNFDEVLGSTPGAGEALATPWPMYRKNAQHTAH